MGSIQKHLTKMLKDAFYLHRSQKKQTAPRIKANKES
jgi:hypothetical protein